MKTPWRFRTLSRFAAVALVLALTGALGVSQATAGQRAAGKTLIIAMDQADMKTLDVSRQFEFAAAFICLNTYDYLLRSKSPAELTTYTPVLATSWDLSKDGKEYTFKLRPNVKFASGNPFTAEDVRFTFTRLKNLKGNASWQMDPLKEVQVVDPLTVKMILNEPNGDWLAILSGQNGGIIDAPPSQLRPRSKRCAAARTTDTMLTAIIWCHGLLGCGHRRPPLQRGGVRPSRGRDRRGVPSVRSHATHGLGGLRSRAAVARSRLPTERPPARQPTNSSRTLRRRRSRWGRS